MNKVLIALLTSLTAVCVYAADDSNKSRVDVKSDASAANKKGDVAHGEVDSLGAKAQAKLSKEEMVAVRATVKAEAAAANKKGEIAKGEITKDKK